MLPIRILVLRWLGQLSNNVYTFFTIMNTSTPQDTTVVHFLLVEDDEVDIRSLKRGFEEHRIANPLIIARDGVEALEILRGDGERQPLPEPYVILLDLNMPRMNGLEFLDALRADPNLQSSIVFVLTTSDDERDVLSAYEQFIAGYMIKSEAGKNFLKVLQLLKQFVVTIHFPPSSIGQ